MEEVTFQIIFEELERADDGESLRHEYELPEEFAGDELDEIDELRRLSLSLKESQTLYLTLT